MKISKYGSLLISSLVLAGCQTNNTDTLHDEEAAVGPCVHLYQDEVLHIDEASGKATGAVIVQIDLSNFLVNGTAWSNESILQGRSTNIIDTGNALRCTLPCSFGTIPVHERL